MVTNFYLRLCCSERGPLAHLPQGFLWLQAVSLETEPKCSKTPRGTQATLIPQGSESHNLSPHACDSVTVGSLSLAEIMALPEHYHLPAGGNSDSGWCAQVPGQQFSERMWPLKGSLGNLSLTAGCSQPSFSHCIQHNRGGAGFRLLGITADWDKPIPDAVK